MKKFYAFVGFLLIAGSLAAQNIYAPANGKGRKINPNSKITKPIMTNKATGSYYLDYEGYDYYYIGSDDTKWSTVVNDVMYNRTDTAGMTKVIVAYDSLVLTQDYTNFESFAGSAVLAFSIDTVFAVFGHFKQPGGTNTVTVDLVDLDAAGRPTDNVLATQTIVTDTSLTGPGDASGYPISVFPFTFNYNLAASKKGRFGISLKMEGGPQDTMMVRFAYPSTGQNCGTTQAPAILPSQMYPSSYYRIYYGTQGNGAADNWIFPRTTGLYVWYYDCNGDGTSTNLPEENPYQDWSIWARVTMTDNTNIENFETEGITIHNIMPNPASLTTNLTYELKNAGRVNFRITDISGKIVKTIALGNQNAGKNTITIDLSDMAAGLYNVSMEANNKVYTKRLMVK